MLEDQVAYLLQRYLGNYVRGLNKEALKISVWQGDVELTNMQLKPEALNALKLPVKVKAGFLGSVKLKVPWSRLGQDPVLVYLDRIFLLAEPATQVEGSSEDAVQEAKKNRIREMEMKLLESRKILETEMNTSWLGSLINTVIGNLKLSISNVHIRYEDLESNPGHPFAAGITLDNLSAFTVDDNGKETFLTGGALERIQKSVKLDRMAIYLDSDISPWYIDKPWEDLLPAEWVQIFKFGTRDGRPEVSEMLKHSYILQPISGNANYSKDRPNASVNRTQPLQKAAVNLDDVTLCLSKNGYRDMLKLADNFTAFNQRLKYCHYRPRVPLNTSPRLWWKYAYRAVSDQLKKASGKMSWEQVLRNALLRKKYISTYASLLKTDLDRVVVDDNEEIEELDRELDTEVILQWRMLAHKVVERSAGSEYLRNQKPNKSWWSFGWTSQPAKDENEPGILTEEDWARLNDIIGYKEGDDQQSLFNDRGDVPYIALDLHMRYNASKLIDGQECLADLSCDNLDCYVKLYTEAKVFEIKLGSYRLLSPNGLLAESESSSDSLVGVFCYKPVDADVDWSLVAKASPCYMTYLKDSVNQILEFFESNAAVSQTLARETASAVQMTIDEVKRTAAREVNKALKERTRFLLDLNIAAPKITIPTDFYPDGIHPTKLLLDLGKLVIRSRDDVEYASPEELNLYSQFDLILRDVSAFLVDGDYHWSQDSLDRNRSFVSFLPVIDRCGVFLKLQQIRSPVATFPSTRLALRLPSLGFHFSPSRYHRLMQVAKIFQGDDAENLQLTRPWDQADWGGWLYHLTWKGVAGREAVWKRRYFCVVGPLLYVLENPEARTYRHYFSLRGKQVYQVPADSVGNVGHVLAVCDSVRPQIKIVEDANAIILRCDSDDLRRTWQNYIQGAIYGASGTASLAGLLETSSDSENSEIDNHETSDLIEKLFLTGILDELKISFSYASQENVHDPGLMKLLLVEERRLLEFRAIGGQVELSMKANDIFIGTVLKALEVEDLVYRKVTSQSCYLARSFIRNAESPSLLNNDTNIPSQASNDMFCQYEGEDEFFEAPETLNDPIGSPQVVAESDWSDLKAPSFDRVGGLLPLDGVHLEFGPTAVTDAVDSFVKAQIVIFDQNSQLYANVDKQVAITLSTLSFYCRRPTILAIMEFVNAINMEEDNLESFSDAPSTSQEIVNDDPGSASVEEPVRSLLGKGKSRVIFCLLLNMARAQIFLVKEDGSRIATLAQNNLLTDIKVFPSSFSIKASLGNLRISDDSLDSNHMYFWACDMRNPGGSSFVELVFSSYSPDDDDYEGYEYSFLGQLSEVRIVYLNRFLQEVISYFMGLVPSNSKDDVVIKDQVTDSDKWLPRSEIEGSPAIMLNLSLKKPIILMPRRTSSVDYLKLDIVQITVRNKFRWFGGSRREMKAVHMDILTILVDDINLNVGSGSELGESIIQDVKGVSIVIQRALRDLLHQIPSTEVAIMIEELKASLSNREYEIITECAQENISETPKVVPPLKNESAAYSAEMSEHTDTRGLDPEKSENHLDKIWVETKISVRIGLVELCLHYGITRDASLATVQVSSVWLLYKSNTVGEGFLSATLNDLTVVDDREGTVQELRLAVGKPDLSKYSSSQSLTEKADSKPVTITGLGEISKKFVPAMLILDARFSEESTVISLCIQRPQLLVALDFLLAVAEFFVPTVLGETLNEDNANSSNFVDAIILDQPSFSQPTGEFSISPQRPLIADNERFDHFVYDGRGGTLFLKDRYGSNLTCPSIEALVYVGNGKKLQFRNVTIKCGQYLDSCILLGSNSTYSATESDNVCLEIENESSSDNSIEENNAVASRNSTGANPTQLIFELQAISPELTFYNTSQSAGTDALSNKLLHAQLDVFCRLVLKGGTVEMSADALGLTMESNGIKILEPFDTSVKFSNSSGKTSIQLTVSDIFMNFSFSILRLFLAVEDDILSFLRTRSKKSTISCSEFDRIGSVRSPDSEQVYTFWRPRAPAGFTILGDYLTPIDKPPAKSVIAVNTSLIRVKRPKSFIRMWPTSSSDDIIYAESASNKEGSVNTIGSIWFPVAPTGYVALGCVASSGREEPPISSIFCISASLVSPCGLRDCISIRLDSGLPDLAFWRVDNAFGTFLPTDPATLSLTQKAYELRHLYFGYWQITPEKVGPEDQNSGSLGTDTIQSERSSTVNSRRRFEAVATFQLIWWNQGSGSRKKLSVWRPVVPEGMIYFGDIAVQGYEPPSTCIVLRDSEDCDLYKPPSDFQLVGHVNKKSKVDTVSFYMPQAPPGFVSLGCVACKGTPKHSDFSSLRCIRSDMVSPDQFLDESIWDTSEFMFTREHFSMWTVGNDLGTFIVRNGLKKPSKRLGFKLVDPNISSESDITVIEAEIKTFSAALFDDYGGLMVPLCNISLSSMVFSFHGQPDSLNSTVIFSLAARSYNDKFESWEPLIEPVEGSLRYQYNPNVPGMASQLRLTSTRDLNLNVSVSNINMLLQAYASWNNLSHVTVSSEMNTLSQGSNFPSGGGRPMIAVYQKMDYYILPQNKLGKDIFIRASEVKGLTGIIKMPADDKKTVKVPVPKTMLNSHLKGSLLQKQRMMVTVVVAEAELKKVAGLSSPQYSVAIRLYNDQALPSQSCLNQQSSRTCGSASDGSEHSDSEFVKWNEVFFFKIDSLEDYMMEFVVNETGKGEPIGYFSSSLQQLVGAQDIVASSNHPNEPKWLELSGESDMDASGSKFGRIKCAVLLPSRPENLEKLPNGDSQSSSIQISPTREGPWTTVKLNYGAPAACWRLGSNVVASEVSVIDGNRYVSIRSLVSVRNDTELSLDLCLSLKLSSDIGRGDEKAIEEFFEYEKYNSDSGWVPYTEIDKGVSGVDLPPGWEWTDEWHVDNSSVNTTDGWVYAPDIERLKWPESYSSLKYVNHARKRRLIRTRKQLAENSRSEILVGTLRPEEIMPLPLPCLVQTSLYVLQLRPSRTETGSEYSWSAVTNMSAKSRDPEQSKETDEIFVSKLAESEKLLYCSQTSGSSSTSSHDMWFCLNAQATEIAKDSHLNPIQDWTVIVKPPISVAYYLPLMAEISLLQMQLSGHLKSCFRGVIGTGETVKVYNADIRNPLYLSLLPQRGWLPLHEAVLLSHPTNLPSKTINLRSSDSGRVVQIILEPSHASDRPLQPKIFKIYSPYWFGIARCPLLSFRLVNTGLKKSKKISLFQTKKVKGDVFEEITEEELHDGYTIASALNFKSLGISASINQSGEEDFGPVQDLSPLGNMDGSLEMFAYNSDGNCMHLFLSSKPCSYQSVPTKVISVRPFMTFTNRVGQSMFVKFSSEDEPKALRVSDARVSFVHHKSDEPAKIQVRLEGTEWSFPVQIVKEDTLTLALKNHDGTRRYIRTEIRGYEEGSRFTVVFRLGSQNGPIRIENRTRKYTIRFRQTGFGNESWIQLLPLSTTNFSWEDPYGQKTVETEIHDGSTFVVCNFDPDKFGLSSLESSSGLFLHVANMGESKVVRFIDWSILPLKSKEESQIESGSITLGGNTRVQDKMPEQGTPLEVIVELGVVGISIVDHRPRELAYMYMESLCISYSTGYDSGTTSRFKLVVGYMQLDNQLPLTVMPVLLAPEQTPDVNHPVFKMTVTVRNESPDGLQIYPYFYIRVTDKNWRINVHEPIIWAMVDFYNNLQIDRIPQDSAVTQVDPEIRVDLIDISEVRLKISLETAPAQRPHGLLGVWSPVLSAVGNAFKIQVHLRKVMHRDRFLRKSSVASAIGSRVWRDLIHNPLHLIFSVDVLGMTSSTLASLSKGFAELSTDGQFLQLRSKQIRSRRITGVGDGIVQGTEALAQGVAFGMSGVLRKPVESARQNGLLGLAHGLGQAFVGIFVQPVSGALDFFSFTVDGIGASCSKCLEILNNKKNFHRIRNPRAFHADHVLREYSEREALGQMILSLAETSRNFGCTEIFKEPSKFAFTDCYEEYFMVPYQRIVLVTNRRVILLQCAAPDKMDTRPCKIMWDVPWEEVMSLELAKAGYSIPSHLIIHLKTFKRAETFVRVIKCNTEQQLEEREPQSVKICSVVRKMWKAYQNGVKSSTLQVLSRQRHVSFSLSEENGRELRKQHGDIISSASLSSSVISTEVRSFEHVINFSKIWTSERESKGRCTLCRKQNSESGETCSIWRPVCSDGYVSIGDIARLGTHPPTVASVYRNSDNLFALPVGFDLVWRNCIDDYKTPVSIWLPRAPEGYVSLGCVAVANFCEPELGSVYCAAESICEETTFEEQKIWSAADSYPWACHMYQIHSEALQFVALRQPKEDSDWKPKRVVDNPELASHDAQ